MDIFKEIPLLEDDRFILRLLKIEDTKDLLSVYSDKYALPFFNSDNCDGDNFYYSNNKKMQDAVDFWLEAYKNGWFVRFVIQDKSINQVIGSVEICLRVSNDSFNNYAIYRLDVRNDYENSKLLYQISNIILPQIKKLLPCLGTITKVPNYAIERKIAFTNLGFSKSLNMLIGKNGYPYDNYWVK